MCVGAGRSWSLYTLHAFILLYNIMSAIVLYWTMLLCWYVYSCFILNTSLWFLEQNSMNYLLFLCLVNVCIMFCLLISLSPSGIYTYVSVNCNLMTLFSDGKQQSGNSKDDFMEKIEVNMLDMCTGLYYNIGNCLLCPVCHIVLYDVHYQYESTYTFFSWMR